MPFMRSHHLNIANLGPQSPLKYQPMELYNLDAITQKQVQNALARRLEYLPMIYTQMFIASDSGGSVVKPVFFDFPTDTGALNDFESYMIGPVKVTPVLAHSSTSTLSSYFPKGKWVSLNDFSVNHILTVATGGMQTLQSTMADNFLILHLA